MHQLVITLDLCVLRTSEAERAMGHLTKRPAPEDTTLLNDYRDNPDVRLRTAARGAAERLRGKR